MLWAVCALLHPTPKHPLRQKTSTEPCKAILREAKPGGFQTGALTLQPLLFWKKQGQPRKKQGVFLFAEPLKSLETKGETHKKKGKSENEKSKETEKSKDWRVRGGFPLFLGKVQIVSRTLSGLFLVGADNIGTCFSYCYCVQVAVSKQCSRVRSFTLS